MDAEQRINLLASARALMTAFKVDDIQGCNNNLLLESDRILHTAMNNFNGQHLSTIRNNLSEISLAQGFQNLTGQVIRQLTDLIEAVDTNLVQLTNTAGQQHTTTTSEPSFLI